MAPLINLIVILVLAGLALWVLAQFPALDATIAKPIRTSHRRCGLCASPLLCRRAIGRCRGPAHHPSPIQVMFSLSELSERVAAYKAARIQFSDFENWFEDNSTGAYDVPELRGACVVVDAALAEYHFDGLSEDDLKVELDKAIHTLVPH